MTAIDDYIARVLAGLPRTTPLPAPIAAKAIDVALVVALAGAVVGLGVVYALITDRARVAPFLVVVALILGSLGFVVYTVLAEWKTGATIAKRAMGLQVMRESGAPIGLGQTVVRQLPVTLHFFWVDVLFALFTERRQRAFELLSKTRVVRL